MRSAALSMTVRDLWGGPYVLTGPVLVVQYIWLAKLADGRRSFAVSESLRFLPHRTHPYCG